MLRMTDQMLRLSPRTWCVVLLALACRGELEVRDLGESSASFTELRAYAKGHKGFHELAPHKVAPHAEAYRTFKGSVEECKQACNNDVKCSGFVHTLSKGECKFVSQKFKPSGKELAAKKKQELKAVDQKTEAERKQNEEALKSIQGKNIAAQAAAKRITKAADGANKAAQVGMKTYADAKTAAEKLVREVKENAKLDSGTAVEQAKQEANATMQRVKDHDELSQKHMEKLKTATEEGQAVAKKLSNGTSPSPSDQSDAGTESPVNNATGVSAEGAGVDAKAPAEDGAAASPEDEAAKDEAAKTAASAEDGAAASPEDEAAKTEDGAAASPEDEATKTAASAEGGGAASPEDEAASPANSQAAKPEADESAAEGTAGDSH